MSQTEIKKVLSEYEKKKKIYAFILSGHIPINPETCIFLTSVLMLKAHEGRSRKVGIRKRKAALLDILYELLTRRKQMQNMCFPGCMYES